LSMVGTVASAATVVVSVLAIQNNNDTSNTKTDQ
jgi:hypothetical protein